MEQVPLDYKNLTAGTTAIAYIKQAASVQPAVGDILFNPGGPGNSGVDEILSSGTLISSLVGEQYNLIGFDPRGVNNSGPAMTCFGNDTLSKQLLDVQYIWPIDSKSNYSIVQEFEWAGAYGDWCTEFNKDTDAKYVGTVAVAHDMLNYIEKKNEAGGEPASDAKLLYYGVSYGTTLGATYAALFPDRIERMILDGVEDSENYYQGGWTTNLFDTDAAIEQLFSTCYAAGPDICPLWLNSTAAIANRTRAIMEAVRADPVPVSDRSVTTYPQLATYEMLAFLIFNSAYSPIQQFPVLTQVLAEMENRNGTTLLQATGGPVAAGISGYLIGCLDSMGRYNLSTVNAWEDHIKGQKAESEWAFETWSTLGLGCRNIRILPPASQMFNGKLLF
jgi:pimeloyl-ACP methyl ester carboxylesterase